ncbi:hypothetical protein ACFWNR_06270 [Streptomyces virginiae]|uniref:hypothetical protein n=1 Tax=Streptomyces virginiae TaxID=1961 RepID=UPI003667ED6A
MTDQPTLRSLALDAARQAIRDGQWWLPPAGQEQLVDAIAAVYQTDLAARLDRILDDIDHHRSAATEHPTIPELGHAHDGMASGLHIAAAHVAHGRPDLVARIRERIPQADQPEEPRPDVEPTGKSALQVIDEFLWAAAATRRQTNPTSAVPPALRGPNWKDQA